MEQLQIPPGNVPLTINLLDPGFRADPYPVYQHLQSQDPVHCLPNGAWFLTRYEDIAELLRDDRRVLKDAPKSLAIYPPGPFREFSRHTMMLIDPPDHSRVRGAFAASFSHHAIAEWQECIQQVVDEILDGLAGRSHFDLVSEFAAPVSAGVIAELFGLPRADRALLIRWGASAVVALDPIASPAALAQADQTAREFTAYFSDLVSQRRNHPGKKDLISALVSNQESHQLTDEEIVDNLAFLIVAGLEIAAIVIGNGMHLLFANPGVCEQLRRKPELMENAVEEIVRLAPPGHIVYRFAAEDIAIGERRIPKGAYIIFCLAAANRDPAQFENPDRLDLNRPAKQNKHLAFAIGSRFCLGAQLARLETRIALASLLERFPSLKLRQPAVKREAVVFQGFREIIVCG